MIYPTIKFCECLSCGEPMNAILSHKVREVCTPCGGKSLTEYSHDAAETERDRLARIREERAERRSQIKVGREGRVPANLKSAEVPL